MLMLELLRLFTFCGIGLMTYVSADADNHHISIIYRKIERIENELRTVKEENRVLKGIISNLKQDVSYLKRENIRISGDKVYLEKQNQEINENVNLLYTEFSEDYNFSSEISIPPRQDRDTFRFGETDPDKKGDTGFRANGRRLLAPVTSAPPVLKNSIGFLAYNRNHQQNLGIHQTVEFPSPITNVGSAYKPSSSIFVAPFDGLYFFSATIKTFFGEDIALEVVQNGHAVAYIYSGGENKFGSGSTSAVLHLNTSDKVWIRIHDNPTLNDGNVRVYANKWSSFCGFQIV